MSKPNALRPQPEKQKPSFWIWPSGLTFDQSPNTKRKKLYKTEARITGENVNVQNFFWEYTTIWSRFGTRTGGDLAGPTKPLSPSRPCPALIRSITEIFIKKNFAQ